MAAKKNSPTKLAARRREVMEQIDALTKEKAQLDAQLLDLDLDQAYSGDGVLLTFTKVHSLDSVYITKRYPATKHPEFYKLALDTAEFKKHFSPKELETMQKITHRISIKDL